MSDHDDDEFPMHFSPFVLGPNGPVPADSEEGKSLLNKAHMAKEDAQRTFDRFIDGFEDEGKHDDLISVMRMLREICTAQDAEAVAAYYLGVFERIHYQTCIRPEREKQDMEALSLPAIEDEEAPPVGMFEDKDAAQEAEDRRMMTLEDNPVRVTYQTAVQTDEEDEDSFHCRSCNAPLGGYHYVDCGTLQYSEAHNRWIEA